MGQTPFPSYAPGVCQKFQSLFIWGRLNSDNGGDAHSNTSVIYFMTYCDYAIYLSNSNLTMFIQFLASTMRNSKFLTFENTKIPTCYQRFFSYFFLVLLWLLKNCMLLQISLYKSIILYWGLITMTQFIEILIFRGVLINLKKRQSYIIPIQWFHFSVKIPLLFINTITGVTI